MKTPNEIAKETLQRYLSCPEPRALTANWFWECYCNPPNHRHTVQQGVCTLCKTDTSVRNRYGNVHDLLEFLLTRYITSELGATPAPEAPEQQLANQIARAVDAMNTLTASRSTEFMKNIRNAVLKEASELILKGTTK